MLLHIRTKIRHLWLYFKVIWSLDEDQYTNTLKLLRYQITIIREDLYINPNMEFWAEKLQDINFVLDLLDKQIDNDYFKNLKLNIEKYQNEFLEVKDNIVQTQEFRTAEEIMQDDDAIYKEEMRQQADYETIFKIITQGHYYIDGMQSWVD